MLDEVRTWASWALGMKPSEVVDAAEVPDADPPAVVVQTHDGQRTLVTVHADDAVEVAPYDGPMPSGTTEGAQDNADNGEDGEAGDQSDGDPSAVDEVPVPDGNAEIVLAWVDQDAARAARALEVERAGKGRTTLIAQLEKLADPPA
ncbi:hypothetical protein [Actinophytocola sediminis]